MDPQVVLGLNAVIVAVTEEIPRILTVSRPNPACEKTASPRGKARHGDASDALPFGPFDPSIDRTLELGLRRWVREQTGMELGYVGQLYTFGNRNRDPLEQEGGPRFISVAYLALVREERLSAGSEALWRDIYRFFPWEDWRDGRPCLIERQIIPVLNAWVREATGRKRRAERRERCDITFGLGGAPWVSERVLDRYELIYEVGLASEAARDHSMASARPNSAGNPLPGSVSRFVGQPMALDHRRILASALGRLRGKLKYRPVVFELLPAAFTLLQLQRVLEALAGTALHKQNLRRLVESGGFVEGTGRLDARTGGRPAELFRFRRDVLRERPAPGVGLPHLRH